MCCSKEADSEKHKQKPACLAWTGAERYERRAYINLYCIQQVTMLSTN